MNKIKTLSLTVISAFLLLLPVTTITTGLAFAAPTTGPDINNSLCAGGNLQVPTSGDVPSCTSSPEDSSAKVNEIVTLVINIFSWVVGVVAVIMIIYGGFQYITAAGDTTKVGNAKNTILYALIGLVIVALSQVIVKFVIGNIAQ